MFTNVIANAIFGSDIR